MRFNIAALIYVSSTAYASAAVTDVPEIDGVAGLAAIGLVGALTALVWERRRSRAK